MKDYHVGNPGGPLRDDDTRLREEREAILRLALEECMQHMSSLRDFVAEGGSIRMVGAREAVLEADAAYDRLGRLLAKGRS